MLVCKIYAVKFEIYLISLLIFLVKDFLKIKSNLTRVKRSYYTEIIVFLSKKYMVYIYLFLLWIFFKVNVLYPYYIHIILFPFLYFYAELLKCTF